jgi:hypothetical protein
LAWTDRPNIQPLGGAIRLDQHPTDDKQHRDLCRAIAAFKIAAETLQDYYIRLLPNSPKMRDLPGEPFYPPCYNSYKPLSDDAEPLHGQTERFEYLAEYSEKVGEEHKTIRRRLIYDAVQQGDGQKLLCIKFVKQYGKKAHVECAKLGFAPKLLGYEELPGEWIMVVMENLDRETYDRGQKRFPSVEATLKDNFMEYLKKFHEKGFVHGDIRPANIMVAKNNVEVRCKLVDFDWAGQFGEVRYPWNMNIDAELGRPADVIRSGLITSQQDMFMAGKLFAA